MEDLNSNAFGPPNAVVSAYMSRARQIENDMILYQRRRIALNYVAAVTKVIVERATGEEEELAEGYEDIEDKDLKIEFLPSKVKAKAK